MKFTAAIATFLVTVAMGAAVEQPRVKATMKPRALNDLCPPLDTPLCCETVVEGVAGLTCELRKSSDLLTRLKLMRI